MYYIEVIVDILITFVLILFLSFLKSINEIRNNFSIIYLKAHINIILFLLFRRIS